MTEAKSEPPPTSEQPGPWVDSDGRVKNGLLRKKTLADRKATAWLGIPWDIRVSGPQYGVNKE